MDSRFQRRSGLFVPTTNIWDVDTLRDIDVTKPEFKELLIRLYQNINNICLTLNLKESGYYFTQEFVNGQVLFPNPAMIDQNLAGRQIFRMVVNFGTLPNATTTSQPHGIDVQDFFTFTRIYGTSTNPVDLTFIPLPYVSSSAVINNIELSADATNVYITTGIDQSAYTTTYIVLEYVKN